MKERKPVVYIPYLKLCARWIMGGVEWSRRMDDCGKGVGVGRWCAEQSG